MTPRDPAARDLSRERTPAPRPFPPTVRARWFAADDRMCARDQDCPRDRLCVHGHCI